MSFPRNHKDSFEPLKTLWKSTMGIQSPSTLPSLGTDPLNPLCIAVTNTEGFRMNPLQSRYLFSSQIISYDL